LKYEQNVALAVVFIAYVAIKIVASMIFLGNTVVMEISTVGDNTDKATNLDINKKGSPK
jgi:hypothetical protein